MLLRRWGEIPRVGVRPKRLVFSSCAEKRRDAHSTNASSGSRSKAVLASRTTRQHGDPHEAAGAIHARGVGAEGTRHLAPKKPAWRCRMKPGAGVAEVEHRHQDQRVVARREKQKEGLAILHRGARRPLRCRGDGYGNDLLPWLSPALSPRL